NGSARKYIRMGRRPWLARRNLSFGTIRKAGHGASLSGAGESVLYGAGPRSSGAGAVPGCAGARGIRRNHRRIAAHGILRFAAETNPRARIARRSVQVVSGSAKVWRRAARWI